jgi:hypothetical protein
MCARVAPSVTPGGAEPSAERSWPRRPDAVALEPSVTIPSPATRAEARGVVSLRVPLKAGTVIALVQSLLTAWQQASLESLLALLASDAVGTDASGHGRSELAESFRQRLQAHDYARLAGIELVHPARIEHWGWDELGGDDTPARPPDMHRGETYVRVPLEVTHEAGERLFGDTILLVLRWEGGRLVIASYAEADGAGGP